MKHTKGFAPVAILLIAILLIAVGGVSYVIGKNSASKIEIDNEPALKSITEQNLIQPVVDSNQEIPQVNNVKNNFVDLGKFSSEYIRVYQSEPWPPIVKFENTKYSCSTLTRDVFDTPTELKGMERNINGRNFCIFKFSDGGAGHYAGVWTYITESANGTNRVDFRADWPNCGGYGAAGEPQYDKCNVDKSFFFENLDSYIASLM